MGADGPPALFWRQTPRMLKAFFDGKAEAARSKQQSRAWLAWHIAALPMTRRFPKLRDFMSAGEAKGPKPKMMPSEMLSIAQRWHARLTNTKPTER